MAKAKKRKTRRNVSRAVVHIKATFNNTTVTITDPNGDALVLGVVGDRGIQGKPQEHSVRRSAGRGNGRGGGDEVRRQGGRGQGQGAGIRSRERHHRDPVVGAADQGHRRRHTVASQWLPPTQEAPGVAVQ